MTPIDLLRAFYEGATLEQISKSSGWNQDFIEMLLRGYIIGITRALKDDDDSERPF